MNDFTYPPSYYKSLAQGLHDRWISTLGEMKDAAPPVQYIFRDELVNVYKEAHKLYTDSLDKLDHISRSQLEHLLARSPEQHYAIITSR